MQPAGSPEVLTSRLWRPLAIVCLLAGGGFRGARAAEAPPDEPDPQPRLVLPDESGYSASPLDGLGTVTVAPDVVGVREPVTLTFVYTADARGIAAGGGVACLVSSFWGWTPPQDRSPEAPGFVTVRCSDSQARLEVSIDSAKNAVVTRVLDGPLRGGQTLTLLYGDTSDGQYPQARGLSDRYAERGERFFFKVDGDGDGWFVPLREQPTFRVEARDAARLVVFGPSRARVDRPFELTIAVLDPSNNLVESYAGRVVLQPQGNRVTCPAGVVVTAEDRGAVRVAVTPTEAGLVRFVAADPQEKLAPAVSNPTILYSSEAHAEYTLYWGDLQGHCNVCDGSGSPEEFYRYARDVARLDVVALTDHDHWGYAPLDENPDTWRRLCELSATWHAPGRFVTFPAYEWTNWTYGHKHVLFRHEQQARVFSWHRQDSDHPLELWRQLGERDCMTISHHPGGDPVPAFWKYHDPGNEPVVEIASAHGVSEFVGHPRCIASPVQSGMVQSALARGYRLGLIGSGDTHDGHPGIGSPGTPAGLAGIYATALTRDAIFEALRARRVYATTGCRAILRFHLGNVPMGGVARLASPAAQRTLSLIVLGDAPIASVEIVKNNSTVADRPGEGLIASWDWTDPQPARNGDYYYARIRQADDHWIWSSPIFIELADR